jgi:fucose permease
LVGFFLFCQSSFEAIINNWTTTYLIQKLSVEESKALYALSLYVLGMAVMRIFIGGIFRSTSQVFIVKTSFVLLLAGCFLLWLSGSHLVAVTGLIAIGAGLAAGFPVMLGLIGNKFADLSGTAFSIVLTIALVGNMIVNFLMGVVAEKLGIIHLPTMAFSLTVIMITLFTLLEKKSHIYKPINI